MDITIEVIFVFVRVIYYAYRENDMCIILNAHGENSATRDLLCVVVEHLKGIR